MKHTVAITPMNASYSTGMNAFMRMEEGEYLADVDRSVYCKSPDLSWFKMKSGGNLTPYLEPAFFGLKYGDTITVKFDALLVSGISDVTVNFIKLLQNSTGAQLTYALPKGTLKSHYSHHEIKCTVNGSIGGELGVLLNIRPTEKNSEIIIKNIEVQIDTQNTQFAMRNNVVSYVDRTDFMKLIKLVTGSDVRTNYSTLYTNLFIQNVVTFPDEYTMAFTGGPASSFRGIAAMFNGSKYRNPIAIYCEVKLDGTDGVTLTANEYDTNGGLIANSYFKDNAFTPTNGVYKKKIFYIQGYIYETRKTWVDLGRMIPQTVAYRNVRIAKPQFDDHTKRLPNTLDELYTNLGLKLR